MTAFSAEELMAFARGLEGTQLETPTQKKPFTVRVVGEGIWFTNSKGEVRLERTAMIQFVCDKFNRTKSKKKSDYNDSFCASYTLAIILKFIEDGQSSASSGFRLPEEAEKTPDLIEGAIQTITVNAFERSAFARKRCIATLGSSCLICGLNFETYYGDVAAGFIHVHHLRPLSEVRAKHAVIPETDLVPVCPNCHAVIHLRMPPYTLDEVKAFLKMKA